MNRPTPKNEAPELSFPLTDGSNWQLKNKNPKHFTLVVFYRGLHCPVCKKYLEKLEELRSEFEEKGVNIVAVSMDTEKRARLSRQKWEIPNVALGYGLDETTARNWGLYFSNGIKDAEPVLFSEPGLFLIDSDNQVYYTAINSNPWGRPHLPSMIKAIDYILENDYPARGEALVMATS